MPWAIRHSQDFSKNPDFLLKVCLQGRCEALTFEDKETDERIAYELSSAFKADLKVVFHGEQGNETQPILSR